MRVGRKYTGEAAGRRRTYRAAGVATAASLTLDHSQWVTRWGGANLALRYLV